jgi:hypothetical protein
MILHRGIVSAFTAAALSGAFLRFTDDVRI